MASNFKITPTEAILNKDQIAIITVTPTNRSSTTEEKQLIIRGSDGSTVKTYKLKLTALPASTPTT